MKRLLGAVMTTLVVACGSVVSVSDGGQPDAGLADDGVADSGRTDAGAADGGVSDAGDGSCVDGVRNGAESDLDCGGSTCSPCGTGERCLAAADCQSTVCDAGRCHAPSCSDAVMNGTETDIDCGGAQCAPCAVGMRCALGPDCVSAVCQALTCRSATCADGVRNQTETDVDCGGTCGGCADGLQCNAGADCTSLSCDAGLCRPPTCNDHVQNARETDVDCGGGTCTTCGADQHCASTSDCSSAVCDAGLCRAPSCTDATRNGTETDVDCGGGTCARCTTTKQCASALDCISAVCDAGACSAPSCTDLTRNGAESDVDCGGSCSACQPGQLCLSGNDCRDFVCDAGVCLQASCGDVVRNGDETDIDCGAACAGCSPGQSCGSNADCESLACDGGRCSSPTCTDGLRNGTETDTDCGGSCRNCPTSLPALEPASLLDSMAFLIAGPHPRQRDVTVAFDPVRFAVVHGRVVDRDGAPIARVTVRVLNHAGYGSSETDVNGLYDLAVEGGGQLTLIYEAPQRLTVQRSLSVPWQDIVAADEVTLTAFDSAVSAIDFTAPVSLHQANPQTDDAGVRRASMLFAQGTMAAMTLSTGASQMLPGPLHVRATEYTVGARGRSAMPGQLPPRSGYTYAVELSVDEAVAAGATSVNFSKPVVVYVDNFLQFPVGQPVPLGFYDRERAAWVPAPDGVVIKLQSITNDKADLVVDGSGSVATAPTLLALGITDAERTELAAKFPVGAQLWRVAVTHFTPWDMNWPFGPPDDAQYPNQPCVDSNFEGEQCPPSLDDCEKCTGSEIAAEEQTLGESLPLAGLPYRLHYRSDRVPGRITNQSLDIQLTGPTVPLSLRRIEVTISVLGVVTRHKFTRAPNQRMTFTWNGRDVWGRAVQGSARATVHIGYVYPAVYFDASAGFLSSFDQLESTSPAGAGGSNGPILADETRNEITVEQELTGYVGAPNPRAGALGGWSLSPVHRYDTARRTLHFGDGRRRTVNTVGPVVTHLSPSTTGNFAIDVAVGPDGSIYWPQRYGNVVLRLTRSGVVTTVAGNGTRANGADGIQATQSELNTPRAIALGPDGSIYIAFSNQASNYDARIRRVRPDGIIETFAGQQTPGYAGDGAAASLARFNNITKMRFGPDGALYVADTDNHRIRRIGPDGIVTTFAGIGSCASPSQGDHGPAVNACIPSPNAIIFGPDGTAYVGAGTYGSGFVRKISPVGVITTLAGGGSGPELDGVAAIGASLFSVESLGRLRDGSIVVAGYWTNKVRVITPEGIIGGFAGYGTSAESGAPAFASNISIAAMAESPDGTLICADYNRGLIARIGPALSAFTGTELFVPSESANEVYVFNHVGRHLRTLSPAGTTRLELEYDADFQLVGLVDVHGRRTTLARSNDGSSIVITAPGGQRSSITLDAAGFLASVTNPALEGSTLHHSAGGLLQRWTDPRHAEHTYTYDLKGRLVREELDSHLTWEISQSVDSGVSAVSLTSAEGRASTFLVERTSSGLRRESIEPTGARLVSLRAADRSEQMVLPDGMRMSTSPSPDPLWGMRAPFTGRVTLSTPDGGLSLVSTTTREVTSGSGAFSTSRLIEKRVVNGRTFTTTFFPDAGGGTFVSETPAGRREVLTLDEVGAPKSLAADPAITPMTFTFTQGRLSTVEQGALKTELIYDAASRPIATVNALGERTEVTYNSAGRIETFSLPSGRTYQLTYDANGNVSTVTPPSGAVHTFGHEPTNIPMSYAPPGRVAAHSSYDGEGAALGITMASGRAITIGFDSGGRRVSTEYPEATVSTAYSGATDRVEVADRAQLDGGFQRTTYTYDGALITSKMSEGAASGTYRYTYDSNFWVTSVTFESEPPALVSHDLDGHPTGYGPCSFTRGGPRKASSAISCGAAFQTSIGFDTLGRRTSRELRVNGTPVFSYALTYDAANRIDTVSETALGVSTTATFASDEDGQLTSVTQTDGGVEQYAYDLNGNRTTPAATYTVRDELMSVGAVPYGFNNDGQLATRGADVFHYSARGELMHASVGGQDVDSLYDENGRLVRRVQGTQSISYFYAADGFQVTHSIDSNDGLSAYVYDDLGQLVAVERGGSLFGVATDQLGSPRMVVDVSGAVVMRVTYDAFGRVVAGDPAAFPLAVGFAGGIADPRTGLVRFGWRDYEPLSGRWTTADPLLFAGGSANLYAYVGNRPHQHIDRTGLVWGMNFHTAHTAAWAITPALWFDSLNPFVYAVTGHSDGNFIDSLSPEDLAERIKKDPAFKGVKKVNLYACNTGGAFAQRLADLLGVPVSAPKGYVVPLTTAVTQSPGNFGQFFQNLFGFSPNQGFGTSWPTPPYFKG